MIDVFLLTNGYSEGYKTSMKDTILFMRDNCDCNEECKGQCDVCYIADILQETLKHEDKLTKFREEWTKIKLPWCTG